MTRFRSARVVATLGALLWLMACSTDDGPAADGGLDADAAPTDVAQDRPRDAVTDTGGTTTFPPGCHYDCFGGTSCRNGVVTTIVYAPVPCGSFTGSCPVAATYTCKEGCSIEPTDIRGFGNPFQNASAADLAVLCKETPSKTAGDPCGSAPTSCLPNRAQERADAGAEGGLHTDYLACQAGSCQPTDLLPSPANYYSPCTGSTTGDGYIASDNCSFCLSFQDPGSACTRTGCTQLCWSDHQCPQGSYCDPTLKDLAHPATTGALCRPGPRNGMPQGLTCMIGARDQ